MKHILLSFALILFALNANAALNKWVDANGKVHYSDTVPPDVDSQTVRSVAGSDESNAPATYTPKSYVEREAELKKENKKNADAARKQAEKDKQAETRKKNCAAAQENVRVLENSPRIATYNDKGEKTYMDDTARAQSLEDARKVVSDSCD
jgi:Domain of unknown function (DUF4124)